MIPDPDTYRRVSWLVTKADLATSDASDSTTELAIFFRASAGTPNHFHVIGDAVQVATNVEPPGREE